MTTPLAILAATNAGAALVGRIANIATKASNEVENAAATLEVRFDDSLAEATRKAFEKLFASCPELKARLGEGPYVLKANAEGSYTLSSSASGKSVVLDNSSEIGRNVGLVASALSIKNLQKGLELRAI